MCKRGREAQDIVLPPSKKVRPMSCNIQRGGGVGALEASRDRVTGQQSSRVAPVLEAGISGVHGRVRDSGGHIKISLLLKSESFSHQNHIACLMMYRELNSILKTLLYIYIIITQIG